MGKKAINAHTWDLVEHEHYVESSWVGRRFFEVERFHGEVCDPCCGFGNFAEGARAAGLDVRAFDIVNRGYASMWGVRDFLKSRQRFTSFGMNPPFGQMREFVEHALRLAEHKVAVVTPVTRLNAAGWMRALPLFRIHLLTPRPSMPPGDVYAALRAQGKEPSGDTKDYAIAVFLKGYEGEPSLRWLHRDGDHHD